MQHLNTSEIDGILGEALTAEAERLAGGVCRYCRTYCDGDCRS